jgi:hypothetical protein
MSSSNAGGLSSPDDLLDTVQAAALLHVSPSTMERWRICGEPALPFLKLGKGKRAPVLYRRQDIIEFLNQNVHVSTSTYGRGE